MKYRKIIIKFGFKCAIMSLFYSMFASGDTNINLPSYGTNTTMPRSDNAFDNAANYHLGEGPSFMAQGIDDDLDVSFSHNPENPRRNSALMLAVLDNAIKKVRNALQNNNDDINYKNADGQTALHYAAANNNNLMIALLLKNGADINAVDTMYKTPLHLAVQNDSFHAAEELIQHGAHMQLKDNEDKTAFDYADNDRMKKILHKDRHEKK